LILRTMVNQLIRKWLFDSSHWQKKISIPSIDFHTEGTSHTCTHNFLFYPSKILPAMSITITAPKVDGFRFLKILHFVAVNKRLRSAHILLIYNEGFISASFNTLKFYIFITVNKRLRRARILLIYNGGDISDHA
jgi:hypothetical protein